MERHIFKFFKTVSCLVLLVHSAIWGHNLRIFLDNSMESRSRSRSRHRSRSQSRSRRNYDVPSTDKTLDNSLPLDFLKQDILALTKKLYIKKWWKKSLDIGDVTVTRISGALTNSIYKIESPSLPSLLLRVYGKNVDNIIDRDSELEILIKLSAKNIGPKLLGIFSNGRFEQFLEGYLPLDKSSLRDSLISQILARRMKDLHYKIDLNSTVESGNDEISKCDKNDKSDKSSVSSSFVSNSNLNSKKESLIDLVAEGEEKSDFFKVDRTGFRRERRDSRSSSKTRKSRSNSKGSVDFPAGRKSSVVGAATLSRGLLSADLKQIFGSLKKLESSEKTTIDEVSPESLESADNVVSEYLQKSKSDEGKTDDYSGKSTETDESKSFEKNDNVSLSDKFNNVNINESSNIEDLKKSIKQDIKLAESENFSNFTLSESNILTEPSNPGLPMSWKLIKKWFKILKTEYLPIYKQLNYNLVDIFKMDVEKFEQVLIKYYEWLFSKYESDTGSNLKFCHNDTQYGNLLLHKNFDPQDTVIREDVIKSTSTQYDNNLAVIDFEYSGANFPAFDIVNQFSEWMSDYFHETEPWHVFHENYPNQLQILNFLKSYIEYEFQFPSSNLKVEQPESLKPAELIQYEIKKLYNECIYWRPNVQIYWFLWGLIQNGIPKNSVESPKETSLPGINGEEYTVTVNLEDHDDEHPEDDDALKNASDDFDYLKYANEKINLVLGDLIQLGIISKEEIDEKYWKDIKYLDTATLDLP